MMDFYDTKIHKAKKVHKCEFCEKTIEVGERYSYESGKFDGDFFVRKLCLDCRSILNDYLNSQQDNEFDWYGIEYCLYDEKCKDCADFNECKISHSPQKCEKIKMLYRNR